MIEMRWVDRLYPVNECYCEMVQVLQYRSLFYPVKIASGDIVLAQNDSAEWIDVPFVDDSKEYIEDTHETQI